MKASRWSIAILCVLIPACGAARPIRYYQLEIPSPVPAPAGTGFGVSLQVGNIEAPPIMRDGRILYQVGTHEVGAYEYHRWVETPDRVVQDSLVRLLRASGKFQSVDTPRNAIKSDYIVQGKIYEFSEMDKPEIHCACRKSNSTTPRPDELSGRGFIRMKNPSMEKKFPTLFTPSIRTLAADSPKSSPALISILRGELRPPARSHKSNAPRECACVT